VTRDEGPVREPGGSPDGSAAADLVAGPVAALPPDPDAYDSPRAVQARARGLAAPYIAGGDDPDAETTRRREGRYLKLLIAMIFILIVAGFVLGYVAQLFGFTA
jgi:hypothetical protein